jgi:hypothetical protein
MLCLLWGDENWFGWKSRELESGRRKICMDNGFRKPLPQEKFYQPFGGSGQCEYLRSLSNLVHPTPQKVLRSTGNDGCTHFPDFKRERVNQYYATPLEDISEICARRSFFPKSCALSGSLLLPSLVPPQRFYPRPAFPPLAACALAV